MTWLQWAQQTVGHLACQGTNVSTTQNARIRNMPADRNAEVVRSIQISGRPHESTEGDGDGDGDAMCRLWNTILVACSRSEHIYRA